MNRKIKVQAYVGGVITMILAIIGLVNMFHPFGASIKNVDGEELTRLLTDMAVGITALGTLIGLVVGYFVHPGEGDGTKEITK